MSKAGTQYQPMFELNDEPLSTTRKVHIRRLNDILHLSLERGDLSRARRAWAILARCKEFDWRTKWRTGLQVLPSSLSSNQSQQQDMRSIDLLKKLMRFNSDEQESILQEIILHLADGGKFREALDELDLHVISSAFGFTLF
ncbi:uncharacterized protein FOMMEDRAFT_30233 [Fomitiporia mediterranea MF3/22]|uniref:uncharacterized protein n=1 Tax=Fomitiporia mediterranea (strain MF3/22) TaxID=694068 RepID=UPI0004407B23|nr:uncharacterized protein FOMMEDRAFT_30233 [Fomitiporia mediterranea MF3/22]EJD01577.1 hypothetical protein FOMMEDRAFT_30233 [Fomitiporia mediterranea MF3/22]